jgi:hypothetical protein
VPKQIHTSDGSVVQRLIHRLTSRFKQPVSEHHLAYENILADLAEIRLAKVAQYGESRYEEDDEEFDLWMCFSDIHRKYIRLKELTKQVRSGDQAAVKPLIDAYRDLANYGIMGVQVIEKYHAKQPLDQS